MLKGLDSAASGMMAQMVADDVAANNIANANVVGFKRSDVQFKSFADMMLNRISFGKNIPLGKLSGGSDIHAASIRFSQGTMQVTGNPLDVALQGDGFFEVQDAKGKLFYTRAGNFTLDQEGYLATKNGLRVNGDGGPIQLVAADNITIQTTGDIYNGDTQIGKIKVVQFENKGLLTSHGENTFEAPTNAVPLPADPETQLVQKHLELGNTNIIKDLIGTMTGMRVYEALQKSIQTQNSMLEKVVNEVGRVRG